MQINTDGLIIREQSIGESDRLVTVLTREQGILRAFVRGAKAMKSRSASSTQLLCYSRLSIYEGREKYIIDEAEPIEVFFSLRTDFEKLSLAQYFCELALALAPEKWRRGTFAFGAERLVFFRQGQAARGSNQGHCGNADAVFSGLYAGFDLLRPVRCL